MKLFLFIFIIFSCASSQVSPQKLKDKFLIGLWKNPNGLEFDYMSIDCKGNFTFKTMSKEENSVQISKIEKNIFAIRLSFQSALYLILNRKI